MSLEIDFMVLRNEVEQLKKRVEELEGFVKSICDESTDSERK